ncbi:MAG: hypothetical protein FGM37_10460, partial [Phycisphaerales bacterium]|nr:hypothetical protein [Phycisphaerales bacterium]
MSAHAALTAALACSALLGCAASVAPPSTVATTAPEGAPPVPRDPSGADTRFSGGEIQYSFVRLGRVPHDGFALPVSDASGSFIAVQE